MDDLLAADLAAFTADQVPEDWSTDDVAPPALNADHANRLLRRIHVNEREADEITALAESEIARIRAWQSDRLSGVTRSTEWATRSLEGFFRQHAESTGVKSLSLPNGTLKLRAARPRVEVVNPELVPDDLMRVKVEVDKTKVAKLATGEWVKRGDSDSAPVIHGDDVVPGVVFVRATEPTFSIEANSEGDGE